MNVISKTRLMRELFFSILMLLVLEPIMGQEAVCKAIQIGNWKTVEQHIVKKVRQLNQLKSAEYEEGWIKLDSIQRWLQQCAGVKDSYIPQNIVVISSTTPYTLYLKCAIGDDLILRQYNFAIHEKNPKKLWYVSDDMHQISEGDSVFYPSVDYLEKRRGIDQKNKQDLLTSLHNIQLQLQVEVIRPPGCRGNLFTKGSPIRVKIMVKNRSNDSINILWPREQNSCKKIVYFEILDLNDRVLHIEDREVVLERRETICWDVLTLEPQSQKEFVHTIFGHCLPSQKAIECHHFTGLELPEGHYRLRMWYDPYGIDASIVQDKKIWQPIELHGEKIKALFKQHKNTTHFSIE